MWQKEWLDSYACATLMTDHRINALTCGSAFNKACKDNKTAFIFSMFLLIRNSDRLATDTDDCVTTWNNRVDHEAMVTHGLRDA